MMMVNHMNIHRQFLTLLTFVSSLFCLYVQQSLSISSIHLYSSIAVVVVIELICILTKSCSSKGFRVAAAVLL